MSASSNFSAAHLLVILAFAALGSASPFFGNNLLVSTVSETTTVSVTSTTTAVCAELVNATTVCNARNGRWLRHPEIMSFDDNLELIDQFINPSIPYRIVPTVYHPEIPRTPFVEPGHGDLYGAYPVQARLFFGFLNNFGATVTRRFTTTLTIFSTLSGTFFISGCTPSPFPFTTC